MLTRKIIVSAIVFVVIFIAGGAWSHQMSKQRFNESYIPPNYKWTIYSTGDSTRIRTWFYPFSPREYVRIISKVTNDAERIPE
ncbi:hypothetical protein [Paenibacillus agricola]|uniref:Uncharacterized protein n=1 Tax=Paenibacillus agricola TaxID=2716264 RepID=A0ABX0JBB0_9BACL|nr:hypothetical protein [Paenibacillus agricola]NHN33233.1 hypothetical protein [Paenibacillus agricola]